MHNQALDRDLNDENQRQDQHTKELKHRAIPDADRLQLRRSENRMIDAIANHRDPHHQQHKSE